MDKFSKNLISLYKKTYIQGLLELDFELQQNSKYLKNIKNLLQEKDFNQFKKISLMITNAEIDKINQQLLSEIKNKKSQIFFNYVLIRYNYMKNYSNNEFYGIKNFFTRLKLYLNHLFLMKKFKKELKKFS